MTEFTLADETSSFDEIVHQTLSSTKYDENDLYLMDENNSSTCYVLFNCTTHTGFCLDWREINDGLTHCKNGEDEKDFSNMELNECNVKTEYRCRNGLCIPRSFLFDRSFDCPDWYDEHKNHERYLDEFTNRCSTKSSAIECEEYRLGLNFFSCGDGQHISIGTHHKYSCWNLRSALLVKTIFRPYFHQIRHDPCNLSMLCVFNVLCLFEYCPNGHEQRCQELLSSFQNRSCLGRFVFPPDHFVFSYIRLVYTLPQTQRTIYPDFLCWNRSIFDTRFMHSGLEIDGFHCMKPNELSLEFKYGLQNFTIYEVVKLILIIQHSFSEYIYGKSHEQLYMCSNSSLNISFHRVMDLYDDCYPWKDKKEDESINNDTRNIVCHLPDRYYCVGEKKCIPRVYLGDTFRDCATGGSDESLFIQCNDDFGCTYLREMDLAHNQWIIYQEVCDTNEVFKYIIDVR